MKDTATEHSPFSHDYIKDEKRCKRCQLIKKAQAALNSLEEEEGAKSPTVSVHRLLELAEKLHSLAAHRQLMGMKVSFAELEEHIKELRAHANQA